MKTVEEYLQHAADCRTMAKATGIQQHREQLEEMAKTWETLAEIRRREIDKRAG